MRVHLHFKTPDVVDNAAEYEFEHIEDPEEREEAIAEFKSEMKRFIKYGENVTLEYNRETKEMTVVQID